ncbi:MAG: DUF2612 domain-containing protein [Methylobacterium organophilum]|nr:DUF2612 domain-containing protein [Methylobacterium organophilum]
MARIGTSRRIGSSLIATNGETLVSRELGRVTTPYREAERFLAYVRGVLEQVQAVTRAVSAIPTFFDIDNAVGEQLTLVGKRLGFRRPSTASRAPTMARSSRAWATTPPSRAAPERPILQT